MTNDIPTVIRYDGAADKIALVVTTLGRGQLEARFQVYQVGDTGRTSLLKDSVWSTEADAIREWDDWTGH